MKNYFKDNTKPSFFPIFLGIISALIGFVVWFICIGKPANLTPAAHDYYALTTTVCAIDRKADVVTCEDSNGNLWEFYGAEDWEIGDCASLLMNSRGTEKIFDDEIISAKFENWG